MNKAMKTLLTVFILPLTAAICLVFSSGCDLMTTTSQTNDGWYAYNYETGEHYQTKVTLLYEGLHCKVYIENSSSIYLNTNDAIAIADEFDTNVYVKITNKFGSEPDQDDDGKVAILVLDIIDGLSGGSYVAGFFDSSQEYDAPNSSHKDIIYMDCEPGLNYINTFYTTMAHEFQHMVNFNQKVFVQGNGPQDTWINEGLSSAAETVYTGTNILSKIEFYNADPYTNIEKGMGFVSWHNELENYSTVYLFFQWLRWQSSNGDSMFKEIINNANSDYLAVQQVANNRMYTGTWKDYIRDWYIANLFNDPTNRFGYKNNITTTIHTLGYTGEYYLYPGEGVYQGMSGTKTATSSGLVDYVGLSNALKVVSSNSGTNYYGTRFLAYNYDGDPLNGTGTAILSVDENSKGFDSEQIVLSPETIQFRQNFLSGKIVMPIDAVINPNFRSKSVK